MKKKKHIIITGTGRAGTTFLVELLTNLGLETGYDSNKLVTRKNRHGRAGLEHNLRLKNCPYIVKDPLFCDYAEEILNNKEIIIEHIFIPIRNLSDAAESRRYVTKTGISKLTFRNKLKHYFGIKRRDFKGGLWHTNSFRKGRQEEILLNQLYKLTLAISSTPAKVTFIKYPKSVKDGTYLFSKLKPILGEIKLNAFLNIYNKTVNLKLVQSFKDNEI